MSILIVHPIAASLAAFLPAAPAIREQMRTRPVPNSAVNHEPAMKAALVNRFKELNIPEPDNFLMRGSSPTTIAEAYRGLKDKSAASHQVLRKANPDGSPNRDTDIGSVFNYNKNADVSILAHELGHSVGQRTDTGRIINNLRHNPKLAASIAAATGLVPLGVAMANEGDDEYATAGLGALALHSPKIIDEALASKNALAMMDTAGIRASLGQRGLLAGSLMSYMAAPVATAALGTAIGNQFDEEPTAI